MAKAGERKVNRTCTYVTATGKTRPAVITALNGASNVDMRVGRHGETYTNVPEMSARTGAGSTSVWKPGSELRY